jgi:hypothetical protein
VGGTEDEMEARLRDILERRKADLRVREVMWQEKAETEDEDEEDYEV